MANILSVAQTALTAAQVGLTTTGHNIANANTPGYSRQVIIQGTATSQDSGFGFVGKGTEVVGVKRVYDEYLASRVLSAQTSASDLNSYYAQIKQINSMLADSTVGLSPALQDFFKGVQTLAADPNSNAARQTLLSSSEALASQFKSMDAQLDEMSEGLNSQINTSVQTINSYAQQIAKLNDAIEKAQAGDDGKPANDLLDQRDQIVSDLSKEIKVTVVKQNSSYGVFIGTGQPLVVASTAFNLVPTTSTTDLSRAQVGYMSNGQVIRIPESSIAGGKLGGLFEFRANTLDSAENSLGRIAIGLAATFNAQHQLGQDQNGAIGGAFFTSGSPLANGSTTNTGTGLVSASITDVNALTTSDYQLAYDGTNYTVTRMSDATVMYSDVVAPPSAIDGVTLTVTGAPDAGDIFLIKPTANGAAGFGVAITDKAKIAAAAPIRTGASSSNKGTGTISAGVVDSSYLPATLATPITLTYDSAAGGTISGFPTGFDVTVTDNGTPTTYTADVASIPYTAGATVSFGGMSFVLAGAPMDNDTFTLNQNTNGVGDNRNALLLGALQSANTLDNSTSSYQGAYAQLVNSIGNKTHELEVTSSAESKLLAQAMESMQGDSGVNLDEEATNLLRYQQAYVAAGKVMQTASKLFDVLLSLGQ